MAKKKTQQTEKNTGSASKKKSIPTKGGKAAAKNTKASPKSPKVRTEYDSRIPMTTVTAIVSLILFGLFLVICIKPEGFLLKAINDLLTGLIGKAGFYFSVPALLYLFFINKLQRNLSNVSSVMFNLISRNVILLSNHTNFFQLDTAGDFNV